MNDYNKVLEKYFKKEIFYNTKNNNHYMIEFQYFSDIFKIQLFIKDKKDYYLNEYNYEEIMKHSNINKKNILIKLINDAFNLNKINIIISKENNVKIIIAYKDFVVELILNLTLNNNKKGYINRYKDINYKNILSKNIYREQDNFSENFKKYHNDILLNDVYTYFGNVENQGEVFENSAGEYILIYADKQKRIFYFNLNLNKSIMIDEFKNGNFFIFNHTYDKINKRDLLLINTEIDKSDQYTYIYELDSFKLITKIIHKNNEMENKLVKSVILSDLNLGNNIIIFINDNLNIYELDGNLIKSKYIGNDNFINCVKTFNINNDVYILTGQYKKLVLYDLKTLYILGNYEDKDENHKKGYHLSMEIIKDNDLIKIIESEWLFFDSGSIRIWDFKNFTLLNYIKIKQPIIGLCLFTNEILYISCEDGSFKILDLRIMKILSSIKAINSPILSIKKIFYSKYKKCLLIIGCDHTIRIWKI